MTAAPPPAPQPGAAVDPPAVVVPPRAAAPPAVVVPLAAAEPGASVEPLAAVVPPAAPEPGASVDPPAAVVPVAAAAPLAAVVPAGAVTVRADAPATADLVRAGWTAVASSWAAELRVSAADEAAVVARLERLVARASPLARIRELTLADADAALALDRATLPDYPGGPATQHAPLTPTTTRPAPARRAWGAFARARVPGAAPSLLAMTFTAEPAAARASADPADPADPTAAEAVETDFTVVARDWRGRGLGSAVKAASVLALLADGHRRFRTGGATDNAASLAASHALGYIVDERWLTLAPPV